RRLESRATSGWLISSENSFSPCSAMAISASITSELRGSIFLMTLTRPGPSATADGTDLSLARDDLLRTELCLRRLDPSATADGTDLSLVRPGPSATADGSDLRVDWSLAAEGTETSVAVRAAFQS